jgi:hypothetical protein
MLGWEKAENLRDLKTALFAVQRFFEVHAETQSSQGQ